MRAKISVTSPPMSRQIFNESIARNASHGQQLSATDKRNLAGKLWQTLGHLRGPERVAEIERLLSVSRDAVERLTADARKSERELAQARAYDLWLDCHSQREIAEIIGREFPAFADAEHTTIGRWLGAKSADAENAPPPDSRQHFDVWQFHTADKDAGAPALISQPCTDGLMQNPQLRKMHYPPTAASISMCGSSIPRTRMPARSRTLAPCRRYGPASTLWKPAWRVSGSRNVSRSRRRATSATRGGAPPQARLAGRHCGFARSSAPP